MADLGLRLTQPAAGPRWLSGERLLPQPGVLPCLKEPSSPSQAPGEEASPPQLLLALNPAEGPRLAALCCLFALAQYSQFGC